MDRSDYDKKMEEHLNNSGCYKILNKDPSSKILKEVTNKIKNSSLDTITKKRITPSSSITPRIYGVPKIHKKGIPLRPIVNTIGSPTYLLAQYLAKKLRPLVGNTSSYIKDSTSFVQWARNLEMKDEDLMVSFDIVSLYTMIPIDEAIDVMKTITDRETIDLLKLCLKSSFFSFKGKIYEQTHGVAMGSPLSPIIANLYMEHFEQKALKSFPFTPEEWKRYVDDIFAKWIHGLSKLHEFLAHINNISNHIKFTIEIEKDNQLPFLDILLTKKDGKLSTNVYRKKTHTERYLHANSHHHPKQKYGIIKTLTTRASRISDPHHLELEINHL